MHIRWISPALVLLAAISACGSQSTPQETFGVVRQADQDITITAPGTYLLAGPTGFLKIQVVPSTAATIIDCGGNSVSSLTVSQTRNFTIKNCALQGTSNITQSWGGVLLNSTIGIAGSSLGLVQVTQTTGLTVSGNTFFGRYLQDNTVGANIHNNSFASGNLVPAVPATFVQSALGHGNTISNNMFDGGRGIDDPIVLQDESFDTVSSNHIQGGYDCGIEFTGILSNSVVSGNTISGEHLQYGIGGWYHVSLVDNIFANNVVSQAYSSFHFNRRCGLRGQWSGGEDLNWIQGPNLPTADTGVYFYGNVFDGNSYTGQVTTCDVYPFQLSVGPGGYLLGYDGAVCNSDASAPTPAEFVVTSNVFLNNSFPPGSFGCGTSPDFGEPVYPGAVVDKGNNACTSNGAADYPLSCVSTVTPLPPDANAVDVFSSKQSGASPACNGTSDGAGTGLAYSGTSVFGPSGSATAPNQDWRYVLALLYGGLDISTGVVDCNSAARRNLVNNWSNLFQNSCANGATVCGDGDHVGAGDGTHAPLWHAFRLDDSSPATATLASLLGLSPAPSALTNNGFGTSPFCNALNWDTSAPNNGGTYCLLGPDDQFVGPGGVPDLQSSCVFHSFSAGDLAGTSSTPNDTNPGCGSGTSGGNHRRPPPGVWGNDPIPSNNRAMDVLPTSYQDNDPIRRPCLGKQGTNNPYYPGEEVCNIDGYLGLVLPIPDSSFVPQQYPSAVQYPTNKCTTFGVGAAPRVFSCAPWSAGVHNGECPNGDLLYSGGCLVPYDSTNQTSNCVASKDTHATKFNRSLAATSDGRAFNLHMRDGSVTGLFPYARSTIVTSSGPVSLDFMGAFGRIHQVEAVFPVGGTLEASACQRVSASDQLACLTQVDPCSVGYAADTGRVDPRGSVDAVRVSQKNPGSSGYPVGCPSETSCQ
jgi:hypothetical protein